MLELRPICENCGQPLPLDSTEAMICSFECTFCKACASSILYNTCPNCDDELRPRPIRNKKYLSEYPGSSKKIYKPVDPKKILELQRQKQADVHLLFSSDFYCITDFICHCRECSTSKPEYSNNFNIAFIRKGHFVYNVFRNSFDAHNSRVLINKPNYEYSVTHKGYEPDSCTIFNFTTEFYEELKEKYQFNRSLFFTNDDIHSLLLKTTAEAEYLHHTILENLREHNNSKLAIDNIVIEMVDHLLENLTDFSACKTLTENIKKNHLATIESAKAYIAENFSKDISLQELSRHCHVSPFHFSRLFKQFSSYSPHQYLQTTRLKHAEMLLKTTPLPITDICFQSGFNSLDYFSAAFAKKYKKAPSKYKAGIS
jgi:AraC family transcriptional regulator